MRDNTASNTVRHIKILWGHRLNSKIKILPAVLVLSLAACETSAPAVETVPLTMDIPEGTKNPQPSEGARTSLAAVSRDIAAREAAYANVMQEARTNAMVNGALRGAVVGLLIDSSAAGAATGAVLGGAIGYSIGDQTGSRIVQSHRNFLLREESLKRVIRAAKSDTLNTSFDLLLAGNFVKTAQAAAPGDAETVARARQSLLEFREFAVSRAVALQEVMPVYEDHPEIQAQLQGELTAQKAMLVQYYANLKSLTEEER